MDFFPPYDQIGQSSPGPWQNANPSAGQQGSIVNAAVFPAVQNEILNVQDEAGITRNAADFTQLLQAIRSGNLTFFSDTGTADALIVTPRTPYGTVTAGAQINLIKSGAANATTTPTLTVSGITKTILRRDGSALAAGDLPANGILTLRCDGAHFRTQGIVSSDVLSTSIFNTFIAQSTVGRSFAVFAVGTSTWTCPAGVYFAKFRLWAGGAGSGGAASGAASAGAGAGGYVEKWCAVTPGTTYTIVVGAKGTGGSAGLNGNAGGSTSVSALSLVAAGGGSSGGATSGASNLYGTLGAGSGGLNFGGTSGSFAQTVSSGVYLGGVGGAAMFSTGPAVFGPGNFPGGGASGVVGPSAGLNGEAGLAIVEF
jgi:hypothetical protein